MSKSKFERVTPNKGPLWVFKIDGRSRRKVKRNLLAQLQTHIHRVLTSSIHDRAHAAKIVCGLKAIVEKDRTVLSNDTGHIGEIPSNFGLPRVVIRFQLQPDELLHARSEESVDTPQPNRASLLQDLEGLETRAKELKRMDREFEGSAKGCGHEKPKAAASLDIAKLQELQSRIDDLLAGRPNTTITPTEENNRLFASFLPADREQAAISAALYTKIAKEEGGLSGLQAAIDQMYEDLTIFPLGMVEHAAKLFLTHYAPAREILLIRSLEERQPGLVHSPC